MKPDWKLVLDEAAFQFAISRSTAERQRLFSALEKLRANPQAEPHFQTRDSSGRILNVLASRPFLLTYWLDSFVAEIRIVDIERVRI